MALSPDAAANFTLCLHAGEGAIVDFDNTVLSPWVHTTVGFLSQQATGDSRDFVTQSKCKIGDAWQRLPSSALGGPESCGGRETTSPA